MSEAPIRRTSSQVTPTAASVSVFQSAASGDLSTTPSMSTAWRRVSSDTGQRSPEAHVSDEAEAPKRTTSRASPRVSPSTSAFLNADIAHDAGAAAVRPPLASVPHTLAALAAPA